MCLWYICDTSCITLNDQSIQHICCELLLYHMRNQLHVCMATNEYILHADNPSQQKIRLTSISFWSFSEAMASLLLPTPGPLACVNGAPSGCPPEALEVEVMPCLSIHGGRAFCAAGPLASSLAPPLAPAVAISHNQNDDKHCKIINMLHGRSFRVKACSDFA